MAFAIKNIFQIILLFAIIFATLLLIIFLYYKVVKKKFIIKSALMASGTIVSGMVVAFGFITFTTGMNLPDLLGIYTPKEGEPTKQEMHMAYDLGCSFYAQGLYENAIGEFKKVNEHYSKFDDARVKLEDSKVQYRRNLIAETDNYIEKFDFPTAFNILDAGNIVLSNDTEFMLKRISYEKNYFDYVDEKANALVSCNDFSGAIETYNNAKPYFTEEKYLELITNKNKEIYLSSILFESKKYIEKGDTLGAINYLESKRYSVDNVSLIDEELFNLTITYSDMIILESQNYVNNGDLQGAISYLKDKSALISDSTSITRQIENLNKKYVEHIITEAQSVFNNSGYQEAISLLENAKTFVGENVLISQEISKYKEYEPSFIWDWDYFSTIENSGTVHYYNELIDNYKEMQYNVISSYGGGILPTDDIVTKDFLLDDKYKKLEGTLFRTYEHRNSESNPFIFIYCDGVCKYDESIPTGGVPKHFNVNLTGVKVLKIVFSTGNTIPFHGSNDTCGGISNLLIYK